MNPKLADVAFKAGGKSYTLNMGVNAMCAIEYEVDRQARKIDPEAEGESAMDVLARMMERPKIRDVRLLLWGGLQRHHPNIDLETAGDIVQALTSEERKAYDLILESIRLAAPKAEDEPNEGGEADVDPLLEAAAGTGTGSS